MKYIYKYLLSLFVVALLFACGGPELDEIPSRYKTNVEDEPEVMSLVYSDNFTTDKGWDYMSEYDDSAMYVGSYIDYTNGYYHLQSWNPAFYWVVTNDVVDFNYDETEDFEVVTSISIDYEPESGYYAQESQVGHLPVIRKFLHSSLKKIPQEGSYCDINVHWLMR